MYTGMSKTAVARAADAMLRALGGTEIGVLFPALGLPDDPSVQLGLVDPGTEEVRFSPVIARTLITDKTGPRRRLELLIAATTVASEAADRNIASPEALFESALGVVFNGELFHIENVTTEYFGNTAYLLRLTVVE